MMFKCFIRKNTDKVSQKYVALSDEKKEPVGKSGKNLANNREKIKKNPKLDTE